MPNTPQAPEPVYKREMPHWGEPYPNRLRRDSLKAAIIDYLLQVNYGSYKPDARKILAVRIEDRTTQLRNAGTPLRGEVYYQVEGEVFPAAGTTRLPDGCALDDYAEELVEGCYERLWIWAAYDITKGSPPGFRKPFEKPLIHRGSPSPNPERKTRRRDVPAELDARFFLPDPVEPYQAGPDFKPDLPNEEVIAFIRNLVKSDFRNALPEGDNPPIWDSPLVGFAAAEDPVFARLQDPEVVGPSHRLPEEWLPGARSVVSVFLPFSEPIHKAYRRDSRYSALEFASGKWNGSKFLNVIRRNLARFFEERGGGAVAPNIDARYDSDHWQPFWSERHVAFAAGIGTFGLQDAMITERGAYGRLCSVITTLAVSPTVRPYREIYGYCLYAFDGSCRACIDRCPSHAISTVGKEVELCPKNGNGDNFRAWGYGSCGHCSTFVPCSRAIPAKIRKALAAGTGQV
jgi:ferredoxin